MIGQWLAGPWQVLLELVDRSFHSHVARESDKKKCEQCPHVMCLPIMPCKVDALKTVARRAQDVKGLAWRDRVPVASMRYFIEKYLWGPRVTGTVSSWCLEPCPILPRRYRVPESPLACHTQMQAENRNDDRARRQRMVL